MIEKGSHSKCVPAQSEFSTFCDHVKYFVNGKLVNEATDLNATKGKILFQTEGAETYHRNLEIAPLK